MDRLLVESAWGAALLIEFQKRGDRFQHAVFVRATGPDGGTSLLEALRSAEGDAGDAWPPSPPLQSLSIENLAGGRRAALLVGMAGRGHWSASIEADDANAALVFDIACRSAVRPEKLLSCYAVGPGFPQVCLTTENTPPAPATVIQDGDWLAVNCPLPSQALGPTWRWRYRIELLPPAG